MAQLIRGACLTGFVEISRSVGADPYRLLDAARLPRSCLRDPDMMIPVAAVGRLSESAAKAAGAEDFGLRLAETRNLSNLGPVGLIVRKQPTIRKAIEALIRYIRLHNQCLSLGLEETGDLVILSPVIIVGRSVPVRQSVELAIGVLHRILRLFLGESWRPQAVCFAHRAPKSREVYWRVFGIAVEFGYDFDGIVLLARDLEAPIPTSDPTMARYVQHYLDSIAGRSTTTLSDKVRELVWVMLPSGRCSIDQVAQRLGVDRRTVHRRLAREGETFSAILDAVRSELVTRDIEDRNRLCRSSPRCWASRPRVSSHAGSGANSDAACPPGAHPEPELPQRSGYCNQTRDVRAGTCH
jgi:AraC-like DNA-binding protein